MNFIPKQDGRAKKISFLMLIGAIVIWMIGAYIGAFYWAVQLLAILLMVVGTQLLGRFVLLQYEYIVHDNENRSPDFIIYKVQGKKRTKVCYVSLSKVVGLVKLSECPNFQEKFGKTKNRFTYCQNLGNKNTYVLIFREYNELIEVRFEPDEAFARELRRLAALDAADADL